jgi:anaerobic selenocysteine-containing dehydrogenase
MGLITRRTFIKGSAAAGGTAIVARHFLFGGPETLVPVSSTSAAPLKEEFINTTCWIGKGECGIQARLVDGQVVKLDGHPDNPRNLGALCPKGQAQITTLYDPNRLTTPLVRTNAKGQPATWKRVSWDEALTMTVDRLKTSQAKDPLLAAYVIGRNKVGNIYGGSFTSATGLTSYGRNGQDCGGASEDAILAMWGVRTVATPDLERCRMLICYWNLTQAGGPELCQVTLPREVTEARERGMKVVAINPHARSVAHLADEWVPIRPGTDMAFWLATINVLFEKGFVDAPFLRAHTNAAALVAPDGTLFRTDGGETAWDEATGAPVPLAAATSAALLGTFDIGGTPVRPALQVLKDSVATNTPEWAAKICGVKAAQIRGIAEELGETASIGATTVIDGVTVPLRPVAYGLHGTSVKFHSAFQTSRATLLAFMMLGALDAAGSTQLAGKGLTDPAATQAKWLAAAANAKPKRIDLGNSAWFPMGSSGYMMFPNTVNDPGKYGLSFDPKDVSVLLSYVNPVLSTRPQDKVIDAWSKFGFVAAVIPYLSATADYAADVILPCGTMDKLEGPLPAGHLHTEGNSIRAPLGPPRGESKGEIEILVEITDRLGKLGGDKGFVANLNKNLKIAPEYALPLDQKPTAETILDAWARSNAKMSLADFLKVGVVSRKIPIRKVHLQVAEPPFAGIRGHFYVEALPKIGALMQAAGVPEELWERYTAYPAWTTPVIEQSPDRYDLYLMDHKRIEFKQTRSNELPLLQELAHENPLVMNRATAARKGLEDGDTVVVESHHPVTGETRRVTTVLRTRSGIRPDTVSLTHHVNRVGPPSVNELFFYGDGIWDISSAWFSHVKVKVRKG